MIENRGKNFLRKIYFKRTLLGIQSHFFHPNSHIICVQFWSLDCLLLKMITILWIVLRNNFWTIGTSLNDILRTILCTMYRIFSSNNYQSDRFLKETRRNREQNFKRICERFSPKFSSGFPNNTLSKVLKKIRGPIFERFSSLIFKQPSREFQNGVLNTVRSLKDLFNR